MELNEAHRRPSGVFYSCQQRARNTSEVLMRPTGYSRQKRDRQSSILYLVKSPLWNRGGSPWLSC